LVELNRLRNQPSTTPLRVLIEPERLQPVPGFETVWAVAATNNFEIRTRELELAQQGFKVRLAKNERYPQVTLAPFYSSEKAADEERVVGVGISLPLPLWNQNGGAVGTASAREQQAEASLQATCREVEGRVANHILALNRKAEEMGRWRKDSTAQLREAAELADRHYRLGAVPATTYLEMQSRYLEALDALLSARQEWMTHWRDLEVLVGRSLQDLR
jgi:cobalt-zinc-cadmium efflux system outer membrane protein